MLNTIAASQTAQTLSKVSGGTTGAAGDRIDYVLVVPATTSPGNVKIKDGGGADVTIFTGGASSVLALTPFPIFLGGEASKSGGWKITTGANVSVVAFGNFS